MDSMDHRDDRDDRDDGGAHHNLMLLVEMICVRKHTIPSNSALNKPAKGRLSSASIPACGIGRILELTGE